MLKYKVSDITSLLQKIIDREQFPNARKLKTCGWAEIVELLHPWNLVDGDGDQNRAATRRLWNGLSREYIDSDLMDEYDNMKHGFRVVSGGWGINAGTETQGGEAVPPERMFSLAQNAYGSTFFRAQNLKRYQWEFETQSVSWDPEQLAKRLPLIAVSIRNVLTALQLINGERTDALKVGMMTEVMVEDAFHSLHTSTSSKWGMRRRIDLVDVPDMSRDDIAEMYRRIYGAK